MCRYLSADECQEVEDQVSAQAGRTRESVAAAGAKKPPPPSSFSMNTISNSVSTRQGGGGGQQQSSSTEIRTLIILVAWDDHKWKRNLMPKSRIDKLWNGIGTDDANIPTGSIANYTKTQSSGRVTLKADIVDWQLSDHTEKYYADGRSALPKSGSNGPDLADAWAYILNQLDIQNFNFNKYDADNDGVIDHVQFLHTGYGAEMGGVDCNSQVKMLDRIWSHMMPAGRSNWKSNKTGKKLGTWSVSSVFSGRCGNRIAPLGIMMHEFYHTLGLPDLYDRDGGLSPGLGGLGAYDMISSPFGANGDQTKPGSLSPWSKMDIGFANAVEIKTNGTYTIRPSNKFSDYFIIKKGFDDEREYLLIENRKNVGMDEDLWGNGVLIYKVDETNGANGNRRRGFPGMSGWPGNGKHYPISLLQADGNYDLEKGKNNGDIGDFFRRPNQKLKPGNGEQVSTAKGTYPNTDGYAFGDIYSSGITIDNFKEASPPGSYTFRVSFDYEPPCQNFRLKMQTDDYPAEISWFVREKGPTPTVLMEGEGNGNSIKCLPLGKCYIFRVDDNHGDGMCCAYGEGQYVGFLDEVEIFKGGSSFKNMERKEFCTAAIAPSSAPTKIPTKQPTKAPVIKQPIPTKAPTKPPTKASNPTKQQSPPPTKWPAKSPTKAPSPTKKESPPPTKWPTKSPTRASLPAKSKSRSPTKAPVAKTCDHAISIYVRTDDKPQQTTWELTTKGGSYLTGYIRPQDLSNNPLLPDTTYLWNVCINGSHNLLFKIYDSGSNGIQRPGGFAIQVDGFDLEYDGVVTGARKVVELQIGNRRLKKRRDVMSVKNSQAVVVRDIESLS